MSRVATLALSMLVVWLVLGTSACSPPPPPLPQTIPEIDRGRLVAIEQALKGDGELAGEVIKVTAQGGLVVLEGAVQTPEEKERAEKIALSIRGVEKVANHLEIKSR